VWYGFEREFEERSREIKTLAQVAIEPASGEADEPCTVCGTGSGVALGAFLGEYTLDLGPEILVWEWELERRTLVFIADTRGEEASAESYSRYSLDASDRMPYCSTCTDEATSDRGLPPRTRITVFSS
jgi:hypothetical protein